MQVTIRMWWHKEPIPESKVSLRESKCGSRLTSRAIAEHQRRLLARTLGIVRNQLSTIRLRYLTYGCYNMVDWMV